MAESGKDKPYPSTPAPFHDAKRYLRPSTTEKPYADVRLRHAKFPNLEKLDGRLEGLRRAKTTTTEAPEEEALEDGDYEELDEGDLEDNDLPDDDLWVSPSFFFPWGL